jgi:hypothetical protein
MLLLKRWFTTPGEDGARRLIAGATEKDRDFIEADG